MIDHIMLNQLMIKCIIRNLIMIKNTKLKFISNNIKITNKTIKIIMINQIQIRFLYKLKVVIDNQNSINIKEKDHLKYLIAYL